MVGGLGLGRRWPSFNLESLHVNSLLKGQLSLRVHVREMCRREGSVINVENESC
jgi:hypothetical protein